MFFFGGLVYYYRVARPGAVHRAGGDRRLVHGQLRDRQGRGDGRRRSARRDAPGRARGVPDLRRGVHAASSKVLFANSASLALQRAADHPDAQHRRGGLEHLGRAAARRDRRSVAREGEGAAGRARGRTSPTRWAASRTRRPARSEPSLPQSPPEASPRPSAPSRFWEWIRHHTTAVISTIVDYSVMVAIVELAHLGPGRRDADRGVRRRGHQLHAEPQLHLPGGQQPASRPAAGGSCWCPAAASG